jgi:hypothetical protein
MNFPIEIVLLLCLPLFLTLLMWNWVKPDRLTVPITLTILSSCVLAAGICCCVCEYLLLKRLRQENLLHVSRLDETYLEMFAYIILTWLIVLGGLAIWFCAHLVQLRGNFFQSMKD